MMKNNAICVLALAGSMVSGFGFDLPRGFKTISELDAAKSEAFEEQEPLAFLISRSSLEPT
ncbi:MAG: hypothetical protein Q7Q71_06585 [Verrucomicrobiota bacterium JB023]|nr:hypothetical protein [Verrucomicrobiota bacterium JB023]